MRGSKITVKCKCGCGGIRLKYDADGYRRFFIKGHWAKTENHIISDEHKQKISIANTGKDRMSPEKRKLINLGRKHSKETIEKIRKAGFNRKHTVETRLKQSLAKRGEKSYLWKGGITSINQAIRCSIEYRLWREAVFSRDNWTCVLCSKRGGKLNADHIKRFSDYPELRFAIDNGRTICVPCHKKTDNYCNKGRKKL